MTGTLADSDRAVRLAIYRGFAGQGRRPSVAGLAAEAGLAETAVRAALRHLHEAHAIVLAPVGDAVRIAHPCGFSTARRPGTSRHIWPGPRCLPFPERRSQVCR